MRAVVPLTLAILVVLQGTWLPHVRILGVMPDAVLVLVTTWALLLGGLAALPLAAGAGLLLDLVSGGPLGLSVVALLVALLAIGWWRGAIFYSGIGIFVIAAVVATLAYDCALLVGMQTFHDLVDWPSALRWIVAPSALLNALLAVPTGYACTWLAARLRLLDA